MRLLVSHLEHPQLTRFVVRSMGALVLVTSCTKASRTVLKAERLPKVGNLEVNSKFYVKLVIDDGAQTSTPQATQPQKSNTPQWDESLILCGSCFIGVF